MTAQSLRRPLHLLGALSFLVVGAILACSSGKKEEENCIGPACENKDPCKTVYDGKCGKSCEKTQDCDSGLHCGVNGKCTAVCVQSSVNSCGDQRQCTKDGRCESSWFGQGGDSGSGNGNGGGTCIDVNVDFNPQVPSVILLVDRSSSMTNMPIPDDYEPWGCPSNDRWRWNVVRNVLFNPESGVVTQLESDVRFGLTLYSSDDFVEPCPMLDKVPIALNNRDAMLDAYPCSQLKEDTPTAESLDDAVADLLTFDEPGPKLIILATDGEPDTCECPDFDGNHVPAECRGMNAAAKQEEAKQGVVATAAAAKEQDITVHVINVSDPRDASLQEHLEEVAAAGGGNVYPGFSPGELKEAFDRIIGGARSCVFDLDGEIASGAASQGDIRLNGEKLPFDDPNGWRANSPSQIELLGEACEALKFGKPELTIKFPCGSFVVR